MPLGADLWWLAIPLLGAATGLRTMTPVAVLCWFAWLKFLPVQGTWGSWTANIVSVIVFTVLAAGEYVGDKLPRTPNRIAPGPLVARLCFGGLVGAVVAAALRRSVAEALALGVAGAVVGSFAGFALRREIVAKLGCRDWWVALAEDAFAVGCAVWALHLVTN